MNKQSIVGVVVLALFAGFGMGYVAAPPQASVDHSAMSMHDTMSSMTTELEGKSGEALERAFLSGMIEHHEGAIAMAALLKAGTTRPELLKMADDIMRVQSEEVRMMEAWQREWFGN